MTKKKDTGSSKPISKTLIAIILLVAAWPLGRFLGSTDMSTAIFWLLLCAFAFITAITLSTPDKERKQYLTDKQKQIDDAYEELKAQLNGLVEQHKTETNTLKQKYQSKEISKQEEKNGRSQLDFAYSSEYTKLTDSYKEKAQEAAKNVPPIKNSWAGYFKLLPVAAIAAFLFYLGSDHRESVLAEQLYEETDTKAWAVKDVPIVHLIDSMCYVSNPDSVLDKHTVEQLDSMYHVLDATLDIEAAVVVVNHVKDNNVESFAQELGNTVGVGRQDRGLVLVLAYRDKLFRIHTGRSLEAELTDKECSNIQQEFFVPAMKKDMPDSAMIYVTKAILSFFQKKEKPVMAFLDIEEDNSKPAGNSFFHYLLVLLGWLGCSYSMRKRLGWSSLYTHVYEKPMTNPFIDTELNKPSGSSKKSRSSDNSNDSDDSDDSYDSSSDSSSSGGSYGGGSFGGGGATTSW